MESVRRFNERERRQMRAEWTLYHEHMSVLHARLADEHREKAERLNGEDSGARGEGAVVNG